MPSLAGPAIALASAVSAAAAVAVETGLPLLVIPAGTFNHFAADLGVEGPPRPWPRCATAKPS
jgi:diacylglycerol kinase family enzyme